MYSILHISFHIIPHILSEDTHCFAIIVREMATALTSVFKLQRLRGNAPVDRGRRVAASAQQDDTIDHEQPALSFTSE